MHISRRRIGWKAGSLFALAVGWVVQSTSVPITSGDSPREIDQLNVAAFPTFVGKAVCAECHRSNFEMHQASGHASTFTLTSEPVVSNLFDGKTVDAGELHGLFHYRSSEEGLLVLRALDESVDEMVPMKFPYALGSGRNAITLFSILREESKTSSIMEHRVSWYPGREGEPSNHQVTDSRQTGRFGLTPGHTNSEPLDAMDCFGERIRGEKMDSCIDCHTTSGKIVDHELTDLIPNVDCEKCHGPGSEHVRLARRMDNPPAFSVGRSDWDGESEIQLCGSCHRLPRHVSPKELRDYSSELLRLQPIGLLRSECYVKSGRSLTCSTCHNPHQDARLKSTADYDQDCRTCHQPHVESQVACSVSTDGGCVKCHMPPISVEQDMVFHDHWIRVRENE
ncbi:multiheme c-type cytochrome [Rhodopirellula europaea]|uniref:Putative secreted protein n=1 Tax=Rhodopirellula europaea SH398 TaxID=1263868 RepID=M5S227_9BACT|nr:multiheme c-type cytochrome [Rhodopirellula europaea]EMI25673.1 putative secreted protein [Rhodopirellula europaea SH398]